MWWTHRIHRQVLLLTDDKACKAKAVDDGLTALRAAEFIERMRPKFPEASARCVWFRPGEGGKYQLCVRCFFFFQGRGWG